MPRSEENTVYSAFAIVFAMFAAWTALSMFGASYRVERLVSQHVPQWLVTANLFLGPSLLAMALWAPISTTIRLTLGMMMLFSLALLEICFRHHIVGSSIALSILFIEAYWLAPRRFLQHRQKPHTP